MERNREGYCFNEGLTDTNKQIEILDEFFKTEIEPVLKDLSAKAPKKYRKIFNEIYREVENYRHDSGK